MRFDILTLFPDMFPPILGALERAGYRGLVGVELSRSSHMAPVAARRSLAFLRDASEARPDV